MYAEETRKMLNESGLKYFTHIDTYEENLQASKEHFADRLFAVYNDGAEIPNPLGTKEGQEKVRSTGTGHTSMSINDFVVIDGEVIICDGSGWLNIGQHQAVTEGLKTTSFGISFKQVAESIGTDIDTAKEVFGGSKN